MNRVNTYDVFNGKDLEIAELIQQRRLQILVHSCIYYEFNSNIISDKQFDEWAKELVQLQKDYPEIASKVRYAKEFEGFEGNTGFDLPLKDDWVVSKALQFVPYHKRIIKEKPVETVKGKFKLF